MHFVPTDANSSAAMFEDLADLFEQAAAGGTPIRAIVGEDPVEFLGTFAQSYSEGGYVPARAEATDRCRFGLIAFPATAPKAADVEDRASRDLLLAGERRRGGGGAPVAPESQLAAPGR
ncbi:hypothetical protein ACF09Z_03245 [Streptomyces erythrochromogenes]|uniref:hypothetical protein n=1 Tax=Streptomyces erythrochromogenes TaxID=285574 RepID=UPI0036F55787